MPSAKPALAGKLVKHLGSTIELKRVDDFAKRYMPTYKKYAAGKVEYPKFQRISVETILASRGKIFIGEYPTGSGKTYIAARVALALLLEGGTGPIIYVASRTILGDGDRTGVIKKFREVFEAFGGAKFVNGFSTPGKRISKADTICFTTPQALARQEREQRKVFYSVLDAAKGIIVDEAHHYPDNTQNGQWLKLFPLVYKFAKRVADAGKVALGLTGTFDRLDELPILGRDEPDARLFLQETVNMGRNCEIYGLDVHLETRAKSQRDMGSFINVDFDDQAAYWDEIAAKIVEVRKWRKVPTAVFVAKRADAHAIAERVNKALRLDDTIAKLHVMLGNTPQEERLQIAQSIRDGFSIGYITVGVGEEGLDVPNIGVVHLVRRTWSFVRNQQAIGRGLRVWPGKANLLVVDYNLMIETHVKPRWLGLSLSDTAEKGKSRIPRDKMINGGPLFAQKGFPLGAISGESTDKARVLLLKASVPRQDRTWSESVHAAAARRGMPIQSVDAVLRKHGLV